MAYYTEGPSSSPKLCVSIDFIEKGDFAFPRYEYWKWRTLPAYNFIDGFEKLPATANITSAHQTLPDFFYIGSYYTVSRSLKETVERLEPNLHQFKEIKIRKKNKKEYFEGEFYLFHITTMTDAIIYEKSNIVKIEDNSSSRGFIQIVDRKKQTRTIKINEVKDRHIWKDRFSIGDIYFSNSLYNDYVDKNFVGNSKFLFAAEE